MKTITIIFTLMCLLAVCSCQKNSKWEYKVFSVSNEGFERSGDEALKSTKVTPTESEINKLGLEGWELVTSYLELETAHPNFGNESYVTGLQPNIRPQRAILIFKRHLIN